MSGIAVSVLSLGLMLLTLNSTYNLVGESISSNQTGVSTEVDNELSRNEAMVNAALVGMQVGAVIALVGLVLAGWSKRDSKDQSS